MFPEEKPKWTLRLRGNKTHCVPRDQSLNILLYLPTQNWKKLRRNRLLYDGRLTNLLRFQGAWPDQVRVQISSCSLRYFIVPDEFLPCLNNDLRLKMNFVRPRELVIFYPITSFLLHSVHLCCSGRLLQTHWKHQLTSPESKWKTTKRCNRSPVQNCFIPALKNKFKKFKS